MNNCFYLHDKLAHNLWAFTKVNKIGDEGAHILAKYLRQNTTLIKLKLESTFIMYELLFCNCVIGYSSSPMRILP